ncbi:hypothetical protein HMPREF9377_02734 [Enterococcus faecalis R712]|nr:hypothetical protein HMPREF9377_02734 [Enterococcus faecalis R712]EFE18993.1 hypothetical protein HMPREF9376_02001 [Enterococcus faecalis S613]EFQ08605.1 hypothetical protein HMPREF9492_03029 [Enterococcus faecalis DAPTO 512]EFQ16065.1 hypothetical protein HMPREF9512_01593 [Enterococcus faecalis EnGen0311]EFT45402.1 hypothetical protein HMPREF9500_00516 [Enterococcus faecalis TX0017]ELA01807.1 hypothetical protein OG1X_2341 [Enterococcus faecalis OG1X]
MNRTYWVLGDNRLCLSLCFSMLSLGILAKILYTLHVQEI